MIQLKLNPSNPRTISKESFNKLKKSLKEFPQMLELRPIIYDESGTILGGNMRYKVLEELEGEGFEVKDSWFKNVDDLTEAQKKEFIIKDNVPFGDWDYDALANEWSDLPLEEWGLDTSGWKSDDVVEDEAPEVSSEEPISKLGEVYQLGRHRLMCGDSTKIEDVEKLMNGQKADMVFTDPPYNVAGESRNFASDVSKAMNDLKNSSWDKDFNVWEVVPLLQSFTNDSSTSYIFTSHFLFGELYKAYKDWANFTSYCVWNKPNPMPSLSKRHWTWNTELCLYATKGKHTFNFPDGENALSGWVTNKHSDGTHPTQKPVELCAKPIEKSSNAGDLVMDLFGGSGSTLIACEQLNRVCYMMELDPKYCDVIRKRYAKFIGKEEEWETITPIL